MNKNKTRKNLISKIASKSDISKNVDSLRVYDSYKKTVEIIKKAKVSGFSVSSRFGVGSTIDFEINKYGAYSTTQKI
jgi:hypothetical protein